MSYAWIIHSWGNKILSKFIKLKENKESVMVKDPISVLYPFYFMTSPIKKSLSRAFQCNDNSKDNSQSKVKQYSMKLQIKRRKKNIGLHKNQFYFLF